MNVQYDIKPEEFYIAEPRADAMIHSLRAFGYDLSTAVADLIDNSISADAKNIWLNFFWDGESSSFSIKDDGRGMTEEVLFNAMRPGSQSPLDPRDPKDLGRFGLGLKTASFSQCKRVTVRTKTKGNLVATRCWDLDYVTETKEWRLLKNASESSEKYLSGLSGLESGTLVLWEKMDRLVPGTRTDDPVAHKRFLEHVDDVKKYLSMVFHRFLERGDRLKIWLSDRPIGHWDPYLKNEKARQELPTEILLFSGQQVIVKPFVLPHQSKIDPETHAEAAGPRGWNAQQGFYIYRNERLLVPGDWLGLGFQKEEHYKLARIQVDIPNTMDNDWAIDVKKSRARPPASLRMDLKRIARLTREKAVAIYRHRGKILARENSDPNMFPWFKKVKHGKIHYSINREWPMVIESLNCSAEHKKAVSALLRLLEETVPVPMITLESSEHPDKLSMPFEGAQTQEILEIMMQAYISLVKTGISPEDAKKRIMTMEPFFYYEELAAIFIEKLSMEEHHE